MMRFYSRLLETKGGNIFLLCFNVCLAVGAYIENLYIQAYCQPVLWASIVLIVFLTSLLLGPFLFRSKSIGYLKIAMFLQGVGVTICLYCLWFLTTEAESIPEAFVLTAFILILGVFSLTPLIYIIQLILNIIRFQAIAGVKKAFFLGVTIPILIVVYYAFDYKFTFERIEKLKNQPFSVIEKELPKTYMTERILGTHYRYHTRLCLWDGWRPPIHDPLLVTSYWLNGRPSLNDERGYSVKLHAFLFPEKSKREACSCAPLNGDSNTYYADYWDFYFKFEK